MKNIFQQHGFPDFDLVGEGGTHKFWLLLQQQDKHPQFQEEVLNAMKEKSG